jgi:ureidoglycolate hydrolase
MKIKSRHISEKNFSPFGRVVIAPKTKPTSQAVDYKFWSDIADYAIEGETEIGICTVYKQQKALITGMERHMRTPEILIPINGPFVLPLLLDGAAEDEACALSVNPGEAVVINAAVWHGACLPKGKKQTSYFVIFRRNTPHEDVQKTSVHPFEIIV